MQDKAYRENGLTGRTAGAAAFPAAPFRSRGIFLLAGIIPFFLLGNRFFGKDSVFSARLCFSAGSAEAEKEVRPFFFRHAESGWPSYFRFPWQESFWTEKHLLFLTGKE